MVTSAAKRDRRDTWNQEVGKIGRIGGVLSIREVSHGLPPDGCVDAFDLAKLLAEWCSVAGGNPCGTCF